MFLIIAKKVVICSQILEVGFHHAGKLRSHDKFISLHKTLRNRILALQDQRPLRPLGSFFGKLGIC